MRDRHHPAPSLAQRERLQLAALFDEVGPDAPTLCDGWSTRDLAAHLVLRESHPAAAGIGVRRLRAWTTRAQGGLARQDFASLVDRFRRGPPRYSIMRLPGAQTALSTFEHYVHHEDVRRAASSWVPRRLAPTDQGALWQQLSARAQWYLRSAPVRLRLVAPDYAVIEVAGSADDVLTLTGPPEELVLHVHGRRDHALVEVAGSEFARLAWDRHELRV